MGRGIRGVGEGGSSQLGAVATGQECPCGLWTLGQATSVGRIWSLVPGKRGISDQQTEGAKQASLQPPPGQALKGTKGDHAGDHFCIIPHCSIPQLSKSHPEAESLFPAGWGIDMGMKLGAVPRRPHSGISATTSSSRTSLIPKQFWNWIGESGGPHEQDLNSCGKTNRQTGEGAWLDTVLWEGVKESARVSEEGPAR